MIRLGIDPDPLPETLTALGGVALLVQTFRSLGLGARVRGEVRVKERERGWDEALSVGCAEAACLRLFTFVPCGEAPPDRSRARSGARRAGVDLCRIACRANRGLE
jgi:hypothetical protein